MALTVISQHRFDPGLIELKRLLDAGALGRLVLGEASTKWYRSQAYYDGGFSGPEGFSRAARSLKSILNELGISWR